MKHPERLGKYPITGVLGEGAMGVVYKAFDPDIKRTVAIKTIRKQLVEDSPHAASIAERFRNEAQAAGRLLHPGIVGVYEYGEDRERAFIAMEYVEGHSVAHYLGRKIRFPEQDILSIMVQLLTALDHAHEQGVWHRDIKPGNLIITRHGKLKIADFGIARVDAGGLTQLNAIVGTPGYMAPEQYTAEKIDHRVDIWSSGVLLYQLLTGQLPFNGTAEALMYRIVHEEPVRPSQHVGSSRAEHYDHVVATALAKRPAARYANALAFRDDLLTHCSAPVSATVSEETVIMEVVRPEGAPGSGGGAAAASVGDGGVISVGSLSSLGSGAPSPTTAAPTHWDPATLSHLETTLAKFVGPMAKVLVRRAARECHDIDTLRQRLAEHLQNERERSTFIGQQLTSASSLRTGAPAPSSSGGGQQGSALNPDTIERAQRVLASHIGPIAKIVVKKAASQAGSREQFFAALAAQFDDPAVRGQVLAQLQQLS
ncbi:serine/threonine protein kinase [Aquabacterium sp. A7-Y]|uniref:serine/threonine-protein kinase n=1 Tax=Aquabacterium sp. A7-Y TaxID=1349605 RepID=UPI00223CF350|nr:serine/threonine-protein kinase [Aquabacterium sp. A7-Y]MCW7539824.1 serine/threonine protein kinase [Aquabacterium sp. A7-Y]